MSTKVRRAIALALISLVHSAFTATCQAGGLSITSPSEATTVQGGTYLNVTVVITTSGQGSDPDPGQETLYLEDSNGDDVADGELMSVSGTDTEITCVYKVLIPDTTGETYNVVDLCLSYDGTTNYKATSFDITTE